MRIAQVAPPWLAVPPPGYGGVENVVALLVDGLVQRGHDVTLFAAGGSATRGRLESFHERPLGTRCQVSSPLLGLPHVIDAFARARELGVDIVHDHSFPFGLALGTLQKERPVVHTVHTAPAAPHAAPVYRVAGGRLPLVALSRAQVRSAPQVRFEATIHNGVAPADFPFRPVKGDHLLFLGRMAPHKGVHLAVQAARRLGRPLLLAAKMDNPEEVGYFKAEVEPLLTREIVYLGEVGAQDKADLLGGAACTLVPIGWDEPFGLVMVESLACGTPVVAFGAGAAPEIVDHGVTGFLARQLDELVHFARRAGDIDPTACREAVEARFTADRMVDAYERLYEALLAGRAGRAGGMRG